jgi:hypothetical protein
MSQVISTSEARGAVEKWLLQVQDVMLMSVRDVVEAAVVVSRRYDQRLMRQDHSRVSVRLILKYVYQGGKSQVCVAHPKDIGLHLSACTKQCCLHRMELLP